MKELPILHSIGRLPARGLLGLVWAYQRVGSPLLLATMGPGCRCRFAPTCSHYAAEAIRTHGAVGGSWLALRRLAKCTPLHPGGVDPVPRVLRCARVGRNAAASRVYGFEPSVHQAELSTATD